MTAPARYPHRGPAGYGAPQQERIYVDLSVSWMSLRGLVWEAIVATALAWVAIGFVDRNSYGPQPHIAGITAHNLLLLIWLLVLILRLVIPVITARRKRFLVTNHRIYAKSSNFGAPPTEIPLRSVYGATWNRKTLAVSVAGRDRPVSFYGLPKAKATARVINQLVGNPEF